MDFLFLASWLPLDTWIVIMGALSAVACALLGCFLVLRRMSMMADAISHAVLPGIAVAFFWSGSRGSWGMFLGAAVTGVLTALFTQWLHRFGRVDQGAAMGVVFTSLFALGLILVSSDAARQVDLDVDCVLYGNLVDAPLERVEVFGWRVPQAALNLGLIVLLNLGFLLFFFKELRLSTFDSSLADTLGFSSQLMHYLLMILVAVSTVAAFEAVGSILVIAFFIVPAATALLLTRSLVSMLILAAGLGVVAALLGHWSAITLPPLVGFEDTSSSGMMATASGLLFLLAWLFSPSQGLIAHWHRTRRGAAGGLTPPDEESLAASSHWKDAHADPELTD